MSVHRDDAYISGSLLGQVAKFSLHASGRWRYAYHSTVKLDDGQDRKQFGWSPREILAGTRVGPAIVVPPTNTPVPVMEPCPPHVRWVPEPAAPDRKVVIATYVVRNPRKYLLPNGARPDAVLPLRTLGALVVASRVVEFSAAERSEFVGQAESMRITLNPDGDPTHMTARLFYVRAPQNGGTNGEPVLWDMTLTLANFHVEAAAV